MDALDILKAARSKISTPEAWGKGHRGRNADRTMETCCAAEAIEDSCPMLDSVSLSGRVRAIRALVNAAGLDNRWGALVHWNDAPERTHAEVLAAYDLAIATLEMGAPALTGGSGETAA